MEVFPATEALEVYLNERGDVVLKQEDALGNDDRYVYIPIIHLSAAIRAMRQVAKEG